MLRSLYAGVSGLKNHQTKMDVVGNNIANVNTIGFKSSRVTFQDIYSQTIAPASAPGDDQYGGVNPQQVGLGVALGSIDVLQNRSAIEYTGAPLDLSIDGDGFFAVNKGGGTFFTRAGNFYTDANNNLVTSGGLFVQGWVRNAPEDVVPTEVPAVLQNIVIDPAYRDISISRNGDVVGIDAGQNRVVIAKLALANFNNQNALEKTGESLYSQSMNSGDPIFGFSGDAQGTAFLNPSSLEMSNVDLAKEFTDMIITQRGFQANSRVITTSDQLLEELVNLKR
jgi:flagellar hook protein FlgE